MISENKLEKIDTPLKKRMHNIVYMIFIGTFERNMIRTGFAE